MHAQRVSSAQADRLEALRRKHSNIDQKVREAQKRPAFDNFELHALKAEKLRVKDEMESLKEAS